MKFLLTFFATTALVTARPAIGSMAFPGSEWELVSPESQGVDPVQLEAAVRFLEQNTPPDGVKRLVIVRRGRVIWQGLEAARRQRVWSVTKAFTSTAHGLLIDDGKCTLDTLAKDFDPELAEHYPAVTLRHLATMTSGIDGAGGSYDRDPTGRGDANALVAPAPPFFPPGTKYQYWDEATQHYGYVLTRISGEPLADLLQRRILGPIGIRDVGWQQDGTKQNIPNWTGGLEISANDLARFGHLFLNRGQWNGKQLISAHWVDEATSVQVPPSIPDALPSSDRKGSGIYGYHWWPNGVRADGTRPWPDAPPGTYMRSGHNNNALFVLPAWDMVFARLGLDGEPRNRGFPIPRSTYNEFIRRLGAALTGAATAGTGRTLYFPPPGEGLDVQARRTPREAGMKPAVIDALRTRKVDRWALWRNGYLLHVEGDWNFKRNVASLRKTWHALTVGAAIGQGRIPSYHQRLDAWEKDLTGNDALATWWHVITQSSAFDYPYDDQPDYRPGEIWTYSDKNPVRLCNALAKVYGKRDYHDGYEDVLRAAYFDAIGMRGWGIRFEKKDDGVRLLLDLEDMGRLGLLMVARGRWNGVPIVPQWFVEELERKQTKGMRVNYRGPDDGIIGLDPAKFPEVPYGYMTWVNTDGDHFPGADRAWAWGSGAGGNVIFWNRNNGIVYAAQGLERDAGGATRGIPHMIEENIVDSRSAAAR